MRVLLAVLVCMFMVVGCTSIKYTSNRLGKTELIVRHAPGEEGPDIQEVIQFLEAIPECPCEEPVTVGQ